jgi:hypothetical protein
MKKTFKKVIAILMCFITILQLTSTSAFAVYYKEYIREEDTISNILGTDTYKCGSPRTSYIYEYNKHFYTVNITNKIVVTQYNLDFNKIDEKTITVELPYWGGFYSGKEYNFIVFGEENFDESLTQEVYRIVKYDKNFNRIGSTSIFGKQCQTVLPFRSGTVAMAESPDGKELTIHTSRRKFKADDGVNHQSQFTVILDIETMTPTNELTFYQNNQVSHSFNQFVQYDGNLPVMIDHGDAYPRSVVLSKRKTNGKYTEVELLKIPGLVGNNMTGISIGGFEISNKNYIVSINTIDHSKAMSNGDLDMWILDKEERDAVLLISAKDNTSTDKVKKIYLTDYVGKNLHATAPYLIKMGNKFVVIWKEYKIVKSDSWYYYEDNGIKYTIIDENGNKLADIQTLGTSCNLSDCLPIYYDGKIFWYYETNEGKRHFATLAINNIGKHEHPLNYVYATDSTCSTEGNIEHYHCVACNKSFTDYSGKTNITKIKTDKSPHTPGEWIITVSPTTTAPGKQIKKCTECNAIVEESTVPVTILGDANRDGNITAIDARVVLQYVAGLETSYQLTNEIADMNIDGNITAVDARIILQTVAGLI